MVTITRIGPEPRREPRYRWCGEVEDYVLDLLEDPATSHEEAARLQRLVGGTVPARKRRNRVVRALKSADALAARGREREGARRLREAILEVLY